MNKFKQLINELHFRLRLTLGMLLAYRFLGQWLMVSKRLPFIIMPFLLIGLSGSIESFSYWLFPEIAKEQLFGLFTQHQTHPWRAPSATILWLLYFVILMILVVKELRKTLPEVTALTTKKTASFIRKLSTLTPQDIEISKHIKLLALSYVYQPELRESLFNGASESETLEKTLVITNSMKAETATVPKLEASMRYQIISELGKGAMGVVYLAQDNVLHRKVALKSLSARLASQQEFSMRFNREARMVAKLNHPSIVQIYDFTEQSGKFIIAMEYIEGKSLDEIIKDKRLEKSVVFDYTKQIASAMSYAHQQGVIHRDLKPGNVLISKNQQVKLTDFGLAKINGTNETQVGTIMGSPLYMSPEQAKGDNVDHRADIYSFGILLYQLLTGALPFQGETALDVIAQHLTQAVALSNDCCSHLSAKEKALISCLMEKEPEKRPQSFDEVLTLLANLNNLL